MLSLWIFFHSEKKTFSLLACWKKLRVQLSRTHKRKPWKFIFSGAIERIIFENVAYFYRILLLDTEGTNAEGLDEIIVTGTMADVIEGEDYTF